METFELENNVSNSLPRASAAAAGSASGASISVTNDSLNAKEHPSVETTAMENKEWTIELKRDSKPGKSPFEATLVFNLNAQNGIITGQVWEGTEPQLLSPVTGTYKPLPGDHRWLMTIEFKWGNVDVTLSGEAVETPDTVHFNGHYRARAFTAPATKDKGEAEDGSLPRAPGDGDTGTGTGQQT